MTKQQEMKLVKKLAIALAFVVLGIGLAKTTSDCQAKAQDAVQAFKCAQ